MRTNGNTCKISSYSGCHPACPPWRRRERSEGFHDC